MLKVEEHTADIRLVISGDLRTIVKELIDFIIQVPEHRTDLPSFKIKIDEPYPDMFFVGLVNHLIAELESRAVKPVSYQINLLEPFRCEIEVFYVTGRWNTNIKAATFWDLKYENNTLTIVLDI